MKNIHILPTDKPSRLVIDTIENKLYYQAILHKKTVNVLTQDIYITSNEKIKEGDWFMSNFNSFPLHNIKELSEREGALGWKQEDLKNNLKIILTTDQDLIKDGVQAIDDEFLEWFVKNPNCEFVKIEGYIYKGQYETEYKIIIPKEEPTFENSIDNTMNIMSIANSMFGKKEEPKQETLEEAAERISKSHSVHETGQDDVYQGVIQGTKWQAERISLMEIELNHTKTLLESCEKALEDRDKKADTMYSEEEVINLLNKREDYLGTEPTIFDYSTNEQWFEQFKKK